MSDLKLRAWDKVRKEYLSAGCVIIAINSGENPKNELYLDIIDQHPDMYKNRFILERFTGMKDKNGVEIWEGDIIALTTADGEDITIICRFGTVQRQIFENLVEITGFYFERSNDGRKTFPIVQNYLGKHDTEIWKVIGNIHRNPEYLTA